MTPIPTSGRTEIRMNREAVDPEKVKTLPAADQDAVTKASDAAKQQALKTVCCRGREIARSEKTLRNLGEYA